MEYIYLLSCIVIAMWGLINLIHSPNYAKKSNTKPSFTIKEIEKLNGDTTWVVLDNCNNYLHDSFHFYETKFEFDTLEDAKATLLLYKEYKKNEAYKNTVFSKGNIEIIEFKERNTGEFYYSIYKNDKLVTFVFSKDRIIDYYIQYPYGCQSKDSIKEQNKINKFSEYEEAYEIVLKVFGNFTVNETIIKDD